MEYWCVVITHNFDFDMLVRLFKTEGQAQEWLAKSYKEYLIEELREQSCIDINNSYCDLDYGIIRWTDGYYTEFRLSDATMEG